MRAPHWNGEKGGLLHDSSMEGFGNGQGRVSATQHRRIMPAERDDQSQGAPLQRVSPDLARHGNDNLERAVAADEFAQSKRRTWEIFFRWLMIGGLLGALALIALLTFIYSGYP
jgi:hypothetical protein